MIGKRSVQCDLFDVGNVWPLELNPKSFYTQLAKASPTLFSDSDFASLYCSDNGRPSVPPSQLALVLLLQNYAGVSDEAAIDLTAYDLRWCAVLGRVAGTPLCAKSTLQLFRAHLVLHEQHKLLLRRSLEEAKSRNLLKSSDIKAALDTKPIIGRGAVLDTYNLLSTAMLQLGRAIARHRHVKLPNFLSENGMENLNAPSIKGAADIDWSDRSARETFLTALVAQARKLMSLADGAVPQIKKAGSLLEQILLQDIREHAKDDDPPKATIKTGTAKGRVPSATDPEQRHGRKSVSKRFTGAKASIAVDAETGLTLSTEVLPGDSPDAAGTLELVKEAEINSGQLVKEVLADCAYGAGSTRQDFADAGRELVAKVPSTPEGDFFPKSKFDIKLPSSGDLEEANVTCPAGFSAQRLRPDDKGGTTFYFDEHCTGCPLRRQCTPSKRGRSIHVHAQESLIQAARKFQATAEGRQKLRARLIVENALARLARLGVGQARYVGHQKTRFQLSIAATVANLRRTWNWCASTQMQTA